MIAPTLLVRTDYDPAIGAGHAMRCLAMAQAWQDAGGTCRFAMTRCCPGFRTTLAAEGIGLDVLAASPGTPEDAAATAWVAQACGARWVVIDGYDLHAGFRRAVRATGPRVVWIDDFGTPGDLACDVVVNPNHPAAAALYPGLTLATRPLIGADYLLLRRAVRAARSPGRDYPPFAGAVLLTFGATQKVELVARTLRLLDWAAGAGPLAIRVTASDPAEANAVTRMPLPTGWPLVQCEVNPPDFPAWLATADLVVVAAGTTLWEAMCLGTPVASFSRNPFQRDVVRHLASGGCALDLGPADDPAEPGQLRAVLADASLRQAMSQAGQALVDGRGADRVTAILREGLGA